MKIALFLLVKNETAGGNAKKKKIVVFTSGQWKKEIFFCLFLYISINIYVVILQPIKKQFI